MTGPTLSVLAFCEACREPRRMLPIGRSLQCTVCHEWQPAPVGRRQQGSLANDYRTREL